MPSNQAKQADHNEQNEQVERIIKVTRRLSRQVNGMSFNEPVTHVYNPLQYAWALHEAYLRKMSKGKKKVVFLGMNPGPWGMAQTGVPFGEVDAVRNWLKLSGEVKKVKQEHPKRQVLGLTCERSEVSGRRLWGLFSERFGTPAGFARQHFVLNYCPLVFMEASGKNRTPDKLPAAEREPLETSCDQHLRDVLKIIEPEWIIGVGAFAEKCAQRVVTDNEIDGLKIGKILHPSPASPAANRGWAEQATKQLVDQGVW